MLDTTLMLSVLKTIELIVLEWCADGKPTELPNSDKIADEFIDKLEEMLNRFPTKLRKLSPTAQMIMEDIKSAKENRKELEELITRAHKDFQGKFDRTKKTIDAAVLANSAYKRN